MDILYRSPDLSIGGFKLWIHKRQSSDSDDFWDANWLDITAHCLAKQANVQVSGTIVHIGDICTFYKEAKQLYSSLSGNAQFVSTEQSFDLTLKMESQGQCKLEVLITPDTLNQNHFFIFSIDQSYLPPVLSQLESIINAYPLKGTED